MICQFCKKEGKKSKIFPMGSITTDISYVPYFDKLGRQHLHDKNTTTTEYKCSHGHCWKNSTSGSCWCGWGKKEWEIHGGKSIDFE